MRWVMYPCLRRRICQASCSYWALADSAPALIVIVSSSAIGRFMRTRLPFLRINSRVVACRCPRAARAAQKIPDLSELPWARRAAGFAAPFAQQRDGEDLFFLQDFPDDPPRSRVQAGCGDHLFRGDQEVHRNIVATHG